MRQRICPLYEVKDMRFLWPCRIAHLHSLVAIIDAVAVAFAAVVVAAARGLHRPQNFSTSPTCPANVVLDAVYPCGDPSDFRSAALSLSHKYTLCLPPPQTPYCPSFISHTLTVRPLPYPSILSPRRLSLPIEKKKPLCSAWAASMTGLLPFTPWSVPGSTPERDPATRISRRSQGVSSNVCRQWE